MIFRTTIALSFFLAMAAKAAQPAPLAPLRPDAARCAEGAGPSFLVRISGLKNRNGTVRVRLFGGSPDTYFEGKNALARVLIPTPAADPFAICIPAPRPGIYAIDVRHDANGDNKSGISDGGGSSGNPQPSIWSLLTKRKPPAAVVQVAVERGVKLVPITMMYVRGGRLRPISE